MTPTVVLAQTESVANWVSAIGQLVGAIGTITVAVVALRWERRERRDREKVQAALVTIEVDNSTEHYGNNVSTVTITNRSDQPVHDLKIKSMGETSVRWGWGQVHLFDENGGEYVYQTAKMLLPSMSTDVPYQYVDADGRIIRGNIFNDTIKKYVHVDDVTITFGMSGARWRRTGDREPVKVAQPAPTQQERPAHLLRARVGPFVADWLSRIRRLGSRR